jgi:FtsZ-binding cell division protein ZapB
LEEARSTVQSIQTQINELKGKSGSSDSETQKLHKAV